MSQSTMTSKGQITIPKDIRAELGLEPGSKVLFVRTGPRDVRLVARTGSVSDLIGSLARPGSPDFTIEDINEQIALAAAEQAMDGLE